MSDANAAEKLSADLEKHRGSKSTKRGKTFCPCHNDMDPSLSVWLNPDGSVGVKCWSKGCTYAQIRKKCVQLGIWPNVKTDDPWIALEHAPPELATFPATVPEISIR